MSGQRGQRGPLFLKCSQCKKQRDARGSARTGKLIRTGRERPAKIGRGRAISRECRCVDCGHVGWYTHRMTMQIPLEIKPLNIVGK